MPRALFYGPTSRGGSGWVGGWVPVPPPLWVRWGDPRKAQERDLCPRPTVALAVEQTLLDMAAIACILTNPLEEVVEYFEVCVDGVGHEVSVCGSVDDD